MSSFYNFDMGHDAGEASALRFPSNIASKYDQYIKLTKYRFDGYDLASLRDPTKFGFNTSKGKTIALPLPDNINDTLSHTYNSTHDLDVLGSFLQGAAETFGGLVYQQYKHTSGTVGKITQAATFFEGTDVKRWSFTWSNLIPNNSSEAKALAKMIKSLQYGSMVDVQNDLFHHPDIYHVTISGPYKQMNFLPCFITNISVDSSPLGHTQFYQDGGMPSVAFSIELTEVTNRTKAIQKALDSQSGSY